MDELVAERVTPLVGEGLLDVVALGKSAHEMADAVESRWGRRVRRRLVVSEVGRDGDAGDVVVGEHPVPGPGSARAGRALEEFLAESTNASTTLFLVSGGASSLCVAPASPLTVEHLRDVWDATVAVGFDITRLNTLRAATSMISGGGVLRWVRTPRTLGVVLVDNARSGAPWVASGLTYDHRIEDGVLDQLLVEANLDGSSLGETLRHAAATRERWMATAISTRVQNVVVAEPATLLEVSVAEALSRGYHVISMGSRIDGRVADVTAQWRTALREAEKVEGPVCVLGVGEVLVDVTGEGLGGRCQEFAWSMMPLLHEMSREAAFVALSSDGRDFVEGVAGAVVTGESMSRARALGVEWADVARRNDTFHGHQALGQLLPGGHTGWNLCDLYVALLR
jgi:hydroxypyruvate reductase